MPNNVSISALTKNRSPTLQDVLIGIIIIGPILGTFCPPEGYFSAHSYQVTASSFSAHYPIMEFISRAVYIVVLLLLLFNWHNCMRQLRYIALGLCLFTVYILSTLWSEDPSTSFKQSLHYYEYSIMIAFLLGRYDHEQLIKYLFTIFTVVTTASVTIMIVRPELGHSGDLTGYESTWRGALDDKNTLGAISAMALIVSTYVLAASGWINKIAWYSVLSNIVLLYESHSATSIICIIIVAAITTLLMMAHSSIGRLSLFILSLISIVLLGAVFISTDTVTSIIGRSATFTGRTDVWRAVVALDEQRPWLGYGIGFWGSVTRYKANVWGEIGWATPHAHNDYLDLILQVGIVGMFFALFNNVFAIFQGLILIRRGMFGAFVFMLPLIFFMIRGFSETISVFPGSNAMMILVLCQARLWKTYSEYKSRDREHPALSQQPSNILVLPALVRI